MDYDDVLADRVLALLGDRDDVSQRRMFGGFAVMVGGHMAVGVLGDDLMVRVGAAAYEDALDQPGARIMDFTGRPMTGFVVVGADAVRDDDALRGWLARALRFVATLPPR